MQSGPVLVIFPILILALGLGAVGLWLLRRGWWPKRQGQTPHCPRCDYILSGNTTGRCPECGGEFTPESIIYGERRRNGTRAAIGLVFLLPAVGLLILVSAIGLRGVRWYQLKPTGWVISDLEQNDGRALPELQRRLKGSTLSGKNQTRLIELALKQQVAVKPGMAANWLVDYLGQSEVEGKLSEEQKRRFFDQAYAYTLHIRPIVAAGEKAPVQIAYRFRTPTTWRAFHETLAWKLDGQMYQRDSGSGSAAGLGAGGSSTTWTPVTTPGEHSVEVVERVRLYAGVTSDGQGRDLRAERTLTLSGKFRTVDPAAAGTIKRIDDDSLKDAVAKSISVRSASTTATPGGDRYLRLTVVTSRPPVDIAFDVFLLSDKEHHVGTLTQTRGSTSHHQYGIEAGQVGDPGKVDLILRPSDQAARRTVSMSEIWGGEVRMTGIQVTKQ